jgi:hypothetical protein
MNQNEENQSNYNEGILCIKTGRDKVRLFKSNTGN